MDQPCVREGLRRFDGLVDRGGEGAPKELVCDGPVEPFDEATGLRPLLCKCSILNVYRTP
jgi:hypothetical protein